jgi:hypothetical protein
LVAFPHRPKHVELPPVANISQSCVVGGLAVGSTVRTSFQFSSVSGYWIAAAAFAAALFAAESTGADGMEGIDEDTAAVALLKKPLTLSRRGICSSATASAGRARRRLDETRILVVCGGRALVSRASCCGRYVFCLMMPQGPIGVRRVHLGNVGVATARQRQTTNEGATEVKSGPGATTTTTTA